MASCAGGRVSVASAKISCGNSNGLAPNWSSHYSANTREIARRSVRFR
jgi:hypothetical protein